MLENGQLAKTYSFNAVNFTGTIYSGPTWSKTGKTAFFRIFRPDGRDADGQMKSIWKDIAVIVPEGGSLTPGLVKDVQVAVLGASLKVRKSEDGQGNVYYNESLTVKAENFRPVLKKEYVAENGSGETIIVTENLNRVVLSGRVFNGERGIYRSETGKVVGLRISHYAGKDENGDYRPGVIKDVRIFPETTRLEGVTVGDLAAEGTEIVVEGRVSVGQKDSHGNRYESILADSVRLNTPVLFSLKEDDGDLPAGDNPIQPVPDIYPETAEPEIF